MLATGDTFNLKAHIAATRERARMVAGITASPSFTRKHFCQACGIGTAHDDIAGCINCWACARAGVGLWAADEGPELFAGGRNDE
jgi:hypothetical protein